MWRQVFDKAERAVCSRLEELVRTEQFAVAVGLVTRARGEVQRRVERASRRVLHFWNLPAGSDVTRIMDQVAQLQRQIRDLRNQLDDREAARNGRTSRPVRSAPKASS